MIQFIGILLFVVFCIWLQMKLYSSFWNHNLDVELKFQSEDLFEGEEGTLTEIIVNDKILPLPLFQVRFQTNRNLLFQDSVISQKTDHYYRNDVFRIGRHEKITRNLEFIASKRGYYHIDSMDVVGGDLFMLTTLVETCEVDEYIYVYPAPFYSKEFLHSLHMVNGMIQTQRQFLEDPFEYRGTREYQPYDDMKSINWKATAKTGDFKVNLRDFTAVKSVRIFLNLEDEGIVKREDCAEVCIRMAAGITKYFSEKGMKVSCYGNCKDVFTNHTVYHNPDDNLQELYRSFARIDLSKTVVDFCSNFEHRLMTQKNGEYTFIVSMNGYEDFVSLLQRYSLVSEDFLWFYPYNQNSDMDIPLSLQKFFKPINIYQIS